MEKDQGSQVPEDVVGAIVAAIVLCMGRNPVRFRILPLGTLREGSTGSAWSFWGRVGVMAGREGILGMVKKPT